MARIGKDPVSKGKRRGLFASPTPNQGQTARGKRYEPQAFGAMSINKTLHHVLST